MIVRTLRFGFTPNEFILFAMGKMLVTGGAGFIGSHLAERLLASGHRVVLLDDLSTGREENLRKLRTSGNVELIQDSVENPAIVDRLVAQSDAVYHLAAAVGVKLVADQPVRTIRTTIHGTEVVLQAAKQHHKPVLITSSSEVYGKGTRVPFAEDDDVVMGATCYSRWCYAYSKGIDEFLALAYHKQFNLPVRIVRLFNTVGPRQVGMYGMVLPRFVEAAVTGKPLTVYGDGHQTRCFCHVNDVAAALEKLMSTPASIGQVFNLGSDEEISMNDLARRVIDLAGSKSPIVHISYEQAYGVRFDDLPRRVPNLTRIKQLISFAPTYDLGQIIDDMIAFRRRAI